MGRCVQGKEKIDASRSNTGGGGLQAKQSGLYSVIYFGSQTGACTRISGELVLMVDS